MKILLTGGTAQLGHAILSYFDQSDVQIDVLTRQNLAGGQGRSNVRYIQADITRSDTLGSLNTPYDAVVHCASAPMTPEATDVQGTHNLITVLQEEGSAGHFIYISIVGIDKLDSRYYRAKQKAESLITDSGMPHTILRVTQFHDFVYDRVFRFADIDKKDWLFPAGLRFQSIDLRDVCGKIEEVIKNGPTISMRRIGGPEILSSKDYVRGFEEMMKHSEVLGSTDKLSEFQKMFTTGSNLCPNDRYGSITWKDFLIRKKDQPSG